MKEKLSRRFPPSAYSVHEEIGFLKAQHQEIRQDISELIQRQMQEIEDLRKQAKALNSHLESLIQAQKQEQLLDMCSTLQTAINTVINGISGLYQKEYPLNVQFEREYYKNFFQKKENLQKDFLELIAGLDQESVETVILALQRLKIVLNSTDPFLSLYSSEEKAAMQHLMEHIFSNVLELTENCYFYRGWFLPANHVEPCVFVDKCGIPYLNHLERLTEQDIIDAGAFIGDSALIFAPLTKRTVYAFEPTPGNYERMLRTIQLNHLTNVVAYPYALGAQKGRTDIAVCDASSTQFKNNAVPYEDTIQADMVTIDDFVREHNLQIGLIKADIEGAESLMLQGAIETIKAQRPALLISIYHNYHDFFKIKPWIESFNLGYKFKIRHSTGGTIMTETILIAEV